MGDVKAREPAGLPGGAWWLLDSWLGEGVKGERAGRESESSEREETAGPFPLQSACMDKMPGRTRKCARDLDNQSGGWYTLNGQYQYPSWMIS
jgi:hypothetical protein